MTFAVGRPLGLLYVKIRQAALAACLSLDATMRCFANLVLATFGTNTLPLSVPKCFYASKRDFCFSPASVSLCLSFHLADGHALSLSVFWLFVGLCFAWSGGR